jgi:two-component system OmpR family sensor kinase/two-component system phosphate regulon sensor histidine kinase PhoR
MRVNLNYKRKLFLYFFVVFVIFTIIIGAFQYDREKQYKTGQLETTLNIYNELVHNYIVGNELYTSGQFKKIDSLTHLFHQKNIRVTIIDFNGKVLYDSYVEDVNTMENHKSRPEVQMALYADSGSNIRKSATTGIKFFYYARLYDNYFVRTAMVYDLRIKELLQPDKIFLLVMLVLFFIIWGSLAYVADKMGKSVSRLSNFALQAGTTGEIDTSIRFPNNEIGIIGRQIVDMFDRLQKTKNEVLSEKEKLIHHIQISNEGVAFFSPEKKKIMANNHFIQYINVISNQLTTSLDDIFKIKELEPVNEFIEANRKNTGVLFSGDLPGLKYELHVSGKYFELMCIFFQDGSFEISIKDVTKLEKRKLLKQEMTNSITEELQTPVTAIKGLLENLLSGEKLKADEQKQYIQKALKQLKRLNKLTTDTSTLTKMEETASLYPVKELSVRKVLDDVIDAQRTGLANNKVDVKTDVPGDVSVKGNQSLIYAIFLNLIENSLQFAGKNITIEIKMYLEDKYNYYFSYADNGKGIPEAYLPKIFDRFYRVETNQEEEYEGSGLGLAIVKNAVLFHKGEITAKNRKKGGIEFLFSLSKK